MKSTLVSSNSIRSPRYIKAVWSETRAACCMLWVTIRMVYIGLEVIDEVFDLERRDGVEGGGRLIEQQHLGLDGDGARDDEALMLPARQGHGAVVQPVFDLVPQGGALDARSTASSRTRRFLTPCSLSPIGDVLVDPFRHTTAPTASQNPAGAAQTPLPAPHADHPITDRPVRRNSTGCKTPLNLLSLGQAEPANRTLKGGRDGGLDNANACRVYAARSKVP